MQRESIVIVSLIVVLVVFNWFTKRRPTEEDLKPQSYGLSAYEEEYAPDFEVELLSGETFRLSEALGSKVVVLNFYTSWCGPCQREIPELKYFMNQRKGQPVVLVMMNVGQKREEAEKFRDGFSLDFPMALDPEEKACKKYLVDSFPRTVVIGKDGKIAMYESGAIVNADISLNPAVDKCLAEKDGDPAEYLKIAPAKLLTWEEKFARNKKNMEAAASGEVNSATQTASQPPGGGPAPPLLTESSAASQLPEATSEVKHE